MNVFAFDPGKTTGYAAIEIAPNGKDFRLFECKEIQWEDRLKDIHEIFTRICTPDIIVTESFRLFPHKATSQIGSQFPSVEVIGIINTFAYLTETSPENQKIQEPGDITKVKVLDRDLIMVAGSPHKIDAYRHARLYFLKHFYMNPFS